MHLAKKQIKSTLILAFVIILISIVVLWYTSYDWEINRIKSELEKIENVDSVEVWAGNYDLRIEDVHARIWIKDKGNIVLSALSRDVNNYPDEIFISEIGEFELITRSQNGLTFGIDIANNSCIGIQINKKVFTPADIINSYDEIYCVIQDLNEYPLDNFFLKDDKEFNILKRRMK